MTEYIEAFKEIGLTLSPGGIWDRNPDSSKTPLDANRTDYLDWGDYPKDNMGRIYLKQEYLVIDIDDHQIASIDTTTIHLTSGVQLPLTFYTTTTVKENIHAYYLLPQRPVPNRTQSKVANKIDTFTGGTIFEGHLAEAEIHKHKIVALPETHPYIQMLYNLPQPKNTLKDIVPLSHPGTARAAVIFLQPSFSSLSKGERNKILRQITPKAFHPERDKRPDMLKHLELTYTLINNTAAKLSAVAELSTTQQRDIVIKLVELLGGDPNYNHNQLDVVIYATLANRDAIQAFNPQDAESIETLLDQQAHTQNPVFKSSLPGSKTTKTIFIRLNKITHEIQRFNNTPFIDARLIQDLVPERQILDKNGMVVGWDDNVPLVELIDDPYEPHITYGDEHPRLNLYTATEYIQQQAAIPLSDPTSNLLYKTIASVVHPNYLDMYLLYMAYIIYHERPPIVYPFFATGGNTQGGTGKSVVSVGIFSLILGEAVHVIKEKDFENSWADSFVGKRLISIEDQPQMSKASGAKLDGYIKQLFSSAESSLNYKGGAVTSHLLKVGLTASSNFLPPATMSNRRLWALSPAHIEGATEPLTTEEGKHLDAIIYASEYQQVIQDLTNHLSHIYHTTTLTSELSKFLFIEAIPTHYKDTWITSNRSFSARVYLLMDNPIELLGLLRDDTIQNDPELASIPQLIEYLLQAYNSNTQKAALSWMWYRQLLGHIQGIEVLTTSKQSVQQKLDVDDFTVNTGFGTNTYPKEKCNGIHEALDNLTSAGPKPPHIGPEAISIYQQYLTGALQ